MYKKETIRIHKAWKEIKKYVNKWENKLAYKNAKSLVKDISSFRELYKSAKGTGNIVQTLKSTLRFKTSLKTARALKGAGSVYISSKTKSGATRKRALRFVKKEITSKSIKELRSMNTHDIVRENPVLRDEIKQMYHELRAKGMTAQEAGKQISSFYFGS